MRAGLGASLCLVVLAATTSVALAAPKCEHTSVRLCDQCNLSLDWKVVQAPQGPAAAQAFCIASWQSLGGLQGFELIEAPHLGTMKFRTYRVAYRGEKLGHDRVVMRVKWQDRANNPRSAVVTYNIDVLPSL